MAQEPERPDEEPASSEEALEFVRKVQAEFLQAESSPENEEKLLKRLSEIGREKLKSIGSRIVMDIMKRPARTIRPEAPTDKGGGSPKR